MKNTSLVLVALLCASPALLAAPGARAADQNQAHKKWFEFHIRQRNQRWAFEDQLTTEERKFEDEQREERRALQREQDAEEEIASTKDAKTIQSVHAKLAAERLAKSKHWLAQLQQHRKDLAQQRKDFEAKLAAERASFYKANPRQK